MIKYPLMVGPPLGADGEARFTFLRDASGRMIAGGMLREDADHFVAIVNAAAALFASYVDESVRDHYKPLDALLMAVGGSLPRMAPAEPQKAESGQTRTA
jgi:hypothetical protein